MFRTFQCPPILVCMMKFKPLPRILGFQDLASADNSRPSSYYLACNVMLHPRDTNLWSVSLVIPLFLPCEKSPTALSHPSTLPPQASVHPTQVGSPLFLPLEIFPVTSVATLVQLPCSVLQQSPHTSHSSHLHCSVTQSCL